MTYHAIRSDFGLTAQVVVRLLAKVADAYKLDRRRRRTFRPLGSIAYDPRILRYRDGAVSSWTVGGRQSIPFVCGARQAGVPVLYVDPSYSSQTCPACGYVARGTAPSRASSSVVSVASLGCPTTSRP